MYPLREAVGTFVRLHSDKHLSFELATHFAWQIELCLGGQEPTSFVDCFNDLHVQYDLKEATKLTDHMYLTHYEITATDEATEGLLIKIK